MLPAAVHIDRQRSQRPEFRYGAGFRDLPKHVLRELEEISFPLRYPAGTSLFTEGEEPRGVFYILSGQVKVFISSGDGKSLIMGMAKAGDVLGLPGTLSGTPYEVTAETMAPVQFAFVKREPFLRFLHAHKEVCLAVAQQLTQMYQCACHEVRCLGLSHTATEKLAQLLLQWPLGHGDRPSRIRFAFRHEDVAQMIGTSRETVSRIFTELKKKGILELNGSSLHIHDRGALQAVAGGTPVAAATEEARRTGANRTDGSATGNTNSDSDYHIDGV